MNKRVVASFVLVSLIIGLAAGSVFFPRTLTRTVTSSVILGSTTTTIVYPGSTSPSANSISTTTINSGIHVTLHTTLTGCSACNTTIIDSFEYPLSVSYNGGPWILHYWVQNYTGTQSSISGNLLGSGNSDISIQFYVAGYVQYTLCASATKAPNNSPLFELPLTLSMFNQNQTATGYNDTVEVCGTIGV